jgi:hypothetical protein
MSDEISDEAKLNALIVRNIGDIESAYSRINNEIQDELQRIVVGYFQEVVHEKGWHISDKPTLDDLRIAPNEWLDQSSTSKKNIYDLSIYLWYIGGEYQWPSIIVGALNSSIGLFFSINLSNKKRREMLESNEFKEIREKFKIPEFHIDLKEAWFGFLIRIDQETLAKGFEDGDVSAALSPIQERLQEIVKSQETLNQLVDLIRKHK